MHLFEETLESEQVYDGKIIKLFKDEVLLENDARACREVIKHPGGVCVVALTDREEVLFVRQYRYPHKSVLLEIPAGKLEWGEKHFDCGKRELLEETGMNADEYTYVGCLLPTPAYCSEVIHIYFARGLHQAEQALDDDEFLDVEKIPLQRAVEMVMKNEITDAKTQIGILKVWLYLKSGMALKD